MTNSPSSRSDLASAYDLLHPEVRRWIRDQGWTSLREIQSLAILEVVHEQSDILVVASTAAGKTEAAFLPALSQVAGTRDGLSVLYVAPLKALINDQFGRLELLCDRLELPVVRWHGDAPPGPKNRLIKRPEGVALITPESIEALFSRRPEVAHSLFGQLDFIIIDEVHAFLAGARGLHLASLLRRIQLLSRRQARRIGLSATLGDVGAAADWLRPGEADRVSPIRSSSAGTDIQLKLHGYIEPIALPGSDAAGEQAIRVIAGHLIHTLRGTNALVFGGSRQRVEIVADLLRGMCERDNVTNEFFPHHGNLSKELREDLERRLKEGRWPTTAVCTSTLELGIDIGSVASVAQIGAPRSISSLKQRLGRSGRRAGQAAVLRVYIVEDELSGRPNLLDRLRGETVRGIAAIRLLGKGFIEAPSSVDGLGSALLHQTLSVIVERGGATAERLYRDLCGAGPFARVTPTLYMDLLRSMGTSETQLIEQTANGTLMLGAAGEKLTASRDFFSLFESGAEWNVVTSGKSLGSLPINSPVMPGNLIVFAGRRWLVKEVHEADHVIVVEPHQGGRPPRFGGSSLEAVDDRLAAEMLDVFLDEDVPGWIDDTLAQLLRQGRNGFRQLDLARNRAIRAGNELHLFTWKGTRSNSLLAILLGASGFTCWPHDFGVVVMSPDMPALTAKIVELQNVGVSNLHEVVADVGAIASGKFDGLIAAPVLRAFWALGIQTAAERLRETVAPLQLTGLIDTGESGAPDAT